ncbi:MAG: RCC1 domain-containing protein [Gemmatimonadales bacterium]
MRNRLVLRFAPAAAFLVLMAGCGENVESPSSPGTGTPEAAAAAAAAATTLSFIQVSAGTSHTCGLTTDSLAYCWGGNSVGQLGDGSNTERLTPVRVSGGLRFVQISAGNGHTCAVTKASLAYCWGDNFEGEVGDGTWENSRSSPTAVAGGRRFHQIHAGYVHTCALNLNDAAFCWGNNDLGQLGTSGQTLTPLAVLGGLHYRQVITAASHTCGVTTGDKAYCWGANSFGELGDGTRTNHPRPVAVAGGLSFQQVVPGSGFYVLGQNEPFVDDQAHTCGVTTDSHAYCWGLGPVGSSLTPFRVPGGHLFRSLTSGRAHVCGVALSRAVFCAGNGGDGELGTGNTTSSTTPVKVASSLLFSSVSAGALGFHTCAVTTDHRVYCWGRNGSGQLGDGTRTNRLAPVAVAGAM